MRTQTVLDPYRQGLQFSAEHRHVEAIGCYEQALAQQPDDPRVLFALGNTARALDMPQPAEAFFRRVLAQDPARLEALVSLANLLRIQGQFEAAEALLRPALSRAPDAAELWLTLGSCLRERGVLAEAAEHYREALARDPNSVPAMVNLADLLTDNGQRDEALALYDRALKREPENAQARVNRAVLHFLAGDLKEAWRDYGARLKVPGKAPAPEHTLPRWTGQSLKRTRLLVSGEQGIGDQLMFASMIPGLAARAATEDGSIVLECEPRLLPLFARSFPDVAVHAWDLETKGGVTRARYGWLKSAGGASAFIEMGSLGKHLRPNIDSFPKPQAYLKPDALQMAQFAGVLESAGRGPFVGVCWRSSKLTGARSLQYAPREAWAAFIARLPGTVVSAQYDATDDEIEALAQLAQRPIVALGGLDQKNDLDRTAALLGSLDAVVTAPTAVAWLAAGIGVDTCKVLYDTSWTAFGQAYEPFAPSCALMMPDTRGDWTNVFDKTLAALSRRL